MAPPRRFAAPAHDGEVLAVPSFDAVPDLVVENRRRLDRADVVIGGLPLRELRALARREVLNAAWDASGRWERPTFDADELAFNSPLLVAGHQPELSHPGVWVKNFALNGLARKLGGTPLHLIVDNDTLKSTSLRFPVFRDREPQSVHLQSVPFDRLDGESPYEDRPIIDAELFETFADRTRPLTDGWGYEPLLCSVWLPTTVWPAVFPISTIGDWFTGLRTHREKEWGCDNLELPVSRLAGTNAFARFACHILTDLPRLREVYNAAVHAYREANGLRSANHPAPDLAPHEAPFWVRTGNDGRRERATPSSDVKNLRPRALTLTLFARVCLGDFFIHGIGGGKYDEVTDAIIRDYFGIESPAYQVLSATLHLPLPGFPGTDEDLRRAEQLVRDLTWNPQRHITRAAAADPRVLRLVTDKITFAANEPPHSDHAARREWFCELHQLTERLRPFVADQLRDAETALARTRAEARANTVLRRRDYAWVLYPEGTLRPFLQRFLEV
jgi:hypothetical protein